MSAKLWVLGVNALPPRVPPCTFTIVHFLSASSKNMHGRAPLSIGSWLFLLWGRLALPGRQVTPRTPYVGGYQRICHCWRAAYHVHECFFPSSIVAFRCSRVVINGTRLVIRNSLYSIRGGGNKIPLAFLRAFLSLCIILGKRRKYYFGGFLAFFSFFL
ncbi:hypothetical protein COCSADRAFT_235670 [Bipolaris sorokiniana ND90Pr]|uniref:Uncharacterized protein n=1 Tax=Cochliobolus sativus (strain ND90Pr / ATCC 201652) TaxID=665912 RepID=M2S0H6_COCSN|nr:uncharacterized protein COCSADRAFT_235670 [Bipolaris sorokiniana ND90Pr]EMD60758.1 hypothetical protein COCSADRAFT_235670 [Bipolaris sorokiniana ND90Pr]